jgi:hypothetical protein
MERKEALPDELFSREEVLGGLPAKRAATLLFLIESRTAHLVEQSRRAMEFSLTEEAPGGGEFKCSGRRRPPGGPEVRVHLPVGPGYPGGVRP